MNVNDSPLRVLLDELPQVERRSAFSSDAIAERHRHSVQDHRAQDRKVGGLMKSLEALHAVANSDLLEQRRTEFRQRLAQTGELLEEAIAAGRVKEPLISCYLMVGLGRSAAEMG